tara:strand:- start:516 stop:734 length:219 start_codon:yes stop_codon:yes gene_type:complete
MELFVVNQSNVDRLIRAAIAVMLIIAYFVVDSSLTMVLLVTAGVLLFNAVSGNCYIYRTFGINTCELPENDA